MGPEWATVSLPMQHETARRILICLLGDFRVLKAGQPVAVRSGGKTEALLCLLALRCGCGTSRDTLLRALWPDCDDVALARQALDSLVHSVHRLLGDGTSGCAPMLHVNGCYRLNVEAGVDVDVARFDALAREGDRQARSGDHATAATCYSQAITLYRGHLYTVPSYVDDVCAGADMHLVVERERLRALYLRLLTRLAEYHYGERDYTTSEDYALRLLANDPCREDAHRLIMRCCVRRGERAQALHQYRLCQSILRRQFDATPEPATVALFDRVRHDPASI